MILASSALISGYLFRHRLRLYLEEGVHVLFRSIAGHSLMSAHFFGGYLEVVVLKRAHGQTTGLQSTDCRRGGPSTGNRCHDRDIIVNRRSPYKLIIIPGRSPGRNVDDKMYFPVLDPVDQVGAAF